MALSVVESKVHSYWRIEVVNPFHKLCLFHWQSSLLSITPWNTAGRKLGGSIRTNEQSLFPVFHTLGFGLYSCHWRLTAKPRAMCLSSPQMAVGGLV